MRLPAGYSARACTVDDLDAVSELIRAADLADVGTADPIREHVEESWRMPGIDLGRDTVAVMADGEMVAQAIVEGLNPSLSLDVQGRVHPEHRGRGLGAALVAWAETRALERSPSLPVLRASTPATDQAGRRLLEERGYTYARTFWHMWRALDAPVAAGAAPDGVAVRGYDHERDVRGTYDALEDAFREHWGWQPFPYDVHVRELERADPSLVAVAAAGDEVVGATIARLVEGEGWVDVVGTTSPWRGRGAAKAMLLRVFEALRAAGAGSVALNVDSGNETGATTLYEAVGMHVHRAWTVFEKRFPRG